MTLLSTYTWPGNLRELQGVLKHAIVQSTGSVLLPNFLPDTVREAVGPDPQTSKCAASADASAEKALQHFIKRKVRLGATNLYDEIIQRVERMMLMDLLRKVDGNMSRASAILGISRSTLRSKLTMLGISIDRTVHMNT
jgi:two-component system nitrogen regulation response regulator GlnG